MKKYKQLSAIILAVLLLISLSACGPQETPAGTSAPAGTNPGAAVTIVTDAEAYRVTVDQMVPIVASVEGAETTVLSYATSDESVATVTKYGKVVGVSAGTAEIIITASDGTTKTVSVTVDGPKYSNVLRVALNVLYNDSNLGCYNYEYGPYVEIHEDGQYTVTFDCTMHLSENSRMMGVTGLDNLTAVFLYDQAVRDGDQTASGITECQIRWDSVSVNGQELTMTNQEFKSALKATGIFDTNDPLNAWDGSSVAEVIVDEENHVLNINVDDPVSITVTFTVQGLKFAE